MPPYLLSARATETHAELKPHTTPDPRHAEEGRTHAHTPTSLTSTNTSAGGPPRHFPDPSARNPRTRSLTGPSHAPDRGARYAVAPCQMPQIIGRGRAIRTCCIPASKLSDFGHEGAAPLPLAAHLIVAGFENDLKHSHATSTVAVTMASNMVVAKEGWRERCRHQRLERVPSGPARMRIWVGVAVTGSTAAFAASTTAAVACTHGPNLCTNGQGAINGAAVA